MHVRAYTAAFNIKGKQQEKLIGDLSGGERSRVHMAKVLRQGVNLLLLDEPTNDLGALTAGGEGALCGRPPVPRCCAPERQWDSRARDRQMWRRCARWSRRSRRSRAR